MGFSLVLSEQTFEVGSDRQKNRHTQHGKVWREKTSASRVLAALASSPATKALDPDPFPRTHSAMPSMLPCCTSDLKRRDKTLVGNKGYRRFLATPDDDHFVIDRAKAEEDAKFDGTFVLRTNADLSPLETMLCYKHLWMVERAFRTSKSLFATRPIFHKLDETIRGHVSCSFLALVLKKELEDRIATLGHASSWPNVLADLDSLTETEVEQDGKRFLLRTPPRPAASLALRAAGVALPPTVRQLADA